MLNDKVSMLMGAMVSSNMLNLSTLPERILKEENALFEGMAAKFIPMGVIVSFKKINSYSHW